MDKITAWKDNKWKIEEYVYNGLPTPNPCKHCGGSAIIEAEQAYRWGLIFISCQTSRKNYLRADPECNFNHLAESSYRKAIEKWNSQN